MAKKKTVQQAAPQQRKDGWLNVLTGIGLTGRDKTRNNEFEVNQLSREELESIWRGDDMASRIIETLPDEMLRSGWELEIQPEESPDGEKMGDKPVLPGRENSLGEENSPEEEKSLDPNADPKDSPDAAKTDPEGNPKPADDRPAPDDDTPEGEPRRRDAFPSGGFGGGGGPNPANAAGALMPKPEKPPAPIKRRDDEAKEQAEKVSKELRKLKLVDRLRDALYYERAYGGSGILIGVDDGQDPRMPLNLEAVKSVKWLTVLSPRELYPVKYYDNAQGPNYGEVEIYRVQPESSLNSPIAVGGPGPQPVMKSGNESAGVRELGKLAQNGKAQAQQPTNGGFLMPEVHESRVIRFGGVRVSRQQILNNTAPGWGDSVLVRVAKVISDFQMTWNGTAILMQDFSAAVIKIKDLADLIATNNDDVVIRRAQTIDMARSIARAVIIDAEEEYERKATPLTGLHELLDKFALRLAAAARMPVTMLMGQSPAGLNATGASDIRMFYDTVSAAQENKLQPALEKLVELVMLAKEGPLKGQAPENWSICFNPPWQLTDLEEAELRFKQAQVDKIEIDSGVVTPEEVAASRHGGDQWSSKTVIDFEGREEMAVVHEEAEAEHAKVAGDAAKKLIDGAAKGAAKGTPNAGPGNSEDDSADKGAPAPGGKPPFPPKA